MVDYGNLDASPDQQDWIKAGAWDLPTTLLPFLEMIGHSEEEWTHFQTLPAFKAMPDGLRRQVDRYFHPDATAKAIQDRRKSFGT